MYLTFFSGIRLRLVAIIFAMLIAGLAVGEDIPLVDGSIWRKSSQTEKQSYIIGVSNLLSVEYAYQQGSKPPPSDEQTIIRRLYEDVDEVTLDGVIARIDQWYKDNPGMINRAVLDVIWVDMVVNKKGE